MKRTYDFTDYLFRCHSIGKLMVGLNKGITAKQMEAIQKMEAKIESGKALTPNQEITLAELRKKRDAKPELSKTAKSELKKLHYEMMFGRGKKIESRYLEKGVMVEEKAITLYSNVKGKLFIKNTKRFTNDFLTGEPDIIVDIIPDIKASFEFDTFPFYDDQLPNPFYYWQIQGYLALTGRDKGVVAYCLVDTPFKLVDDAIRRLDWKHDLFDGNGNIKSEDSIPLIVEKVQNHIFSTEALEEYCHQSLSVELSWFTNFVEMPPEYRVKEFIVERNDKDIEAMYSQIELARKHLNNLSLKIADKHLKSEAA